MDDIPNFLEPISHSMPEGAWPEDSFPSESSEGNLLDQVLCCDLIIEGDSSYLLAQLSLAILHEIEMPFSLVKGISFVFGSDDASDIHLFRLRLQIGEIPEGDPPGEDLPEDSEMPLEDSTTEEVHDEESETSNPPGPIPWFVQVDLNLLSVRFSRDLLIPVRRDEAEGRIVPKEGNVQINFSSTLRVNQDGDISFIFGSTSEEATADEVQPALVVSDPFWIGSSKVMLSAEEISFHLSASDPLPAWIQTDLGSGIYIRQLTVSLPEDMHLLVDQISGYNIAFTDGGFSGRIEGAWQQRLSEDQKRFIENDGAGTLFGMPIALRKLDFEFKQNAFIASTLACDLIPPLIDKPIGLELSINGDGKFTAVVSASDLAPSTTRNIIEIQRDGLFSFIVRSAGFAYENNIGTFKLSGAIQPLLGGIEWPRFEIQKFSINTDGEIDIDGGWMDVPETLTLDFHGFKIDVVQVGMGSEEPPEDAPDGTVPRQWAGFSGTIRLVEGIPLSASVRGLKVSWDPSRPPTEAEPMRGVQVDLDGIGVSMEIPGTLALSGSVFFDTLDRPPDHIPAASDDAAAEDGSSGASPGAGASAGVFGNLFTGSVNVNLICLRTEITGELLIGDLTTYHYEVDQNNTDQMMLVIDEKFTAFYIVLDAQLPAAIPLGATGAGLYGLTGLFGIHVAPDREMVDGEEQSWYLWYKQAKGGVEGSAYNVTKVIKWWPRFDHYAFGAGLCLGTMYDDGFTINACALVVVLVPGPVIMIEGRANLLKQRGGDTGHNAEGSLYMLIVFDGLDETFSMNIDINFSLEDVITVGGGLEAFFDFKDSERWYIYIGRKEPEEKRIRAEVLSIISASAYFMIDPNAIQFGARAGIDLQMEYGPVEIKLILTIRFEIGIFFKHPQVTGLIELYGEISIKIFGIGIGLILQALLEGSAPQPWWIHGLARVAVNLFFPLPSFDVTVEFTWGESERPAAVELLKGAAIIHPKLPSAGWALVEGEEGPVVPVDAVAVLSCAKPISMVSRTRDENGQLVDFKVETVEGWEYGYDIVSVILTDLDRNEEVSYQMNATAEGLPNGRQTPWLNGQGKLLPVPQLDANGEQMIVQEPHVQLWGYAPLEHRPVDSGRPLAVCEESDEISAQDPVYRCVNFRSLVNGTIMPQIFSHRGLNFSTPPGTFAKVNGAGLAAYLSAPGLVIRFPEPVALVVLTFNGAPHPASAFYRGSAVPDSPSSDGIISGPLDTLSITLRQSMTELRLVSVCYETVQAKDRRTQTRTEQPPERHPTSLPVETLLKPNTRYMLAVVAQQRERRVGDVGFVINRQEPEPKVYYFRTADAPGLNPTGPKVPPELAVDFRDGPLNRLETYVAATLPANGARVFYPDYGVLVAFNEAYAASLYGERLRMRFKDRNGKELKTRDGRAAFWERIKGRNMPFIKKGLTDYTDAPSPEGCDSPRTWHKVEQEFVVGRLPETARLQRMVTAELVVDSQVLYSFPFTLSRFRNIREHLTKGLDAGGAPVIRTRLREITTPEAWPDLTEASDKAQLVRDARYSLYVSVAISPTEADFFTVEEAFAAVEEAKKALHTFWQNNYAPLDRAVQPAFGQAEMGHRPLPPRMELVQVRVTGGERMFLLLESPEPLDPTRLTLKYGGGRDARLVWSEDGTRAFLFSAEADGLFAPGSYEFTFYYHYGGPSALDLLPVYVDGVLGDEEEQVTWNVSLM